MGMQIDKYPVLGYIFGFLGSLPHYSEEIFVALLLGFVGAFGGWLFELAKIKILLKLQEKKNLKITKEIKMDKIKSTITKILSAWVGIGTALMFIGATGLIPIPEILLNLFSKDIANLIGGTTDAILTAVGAVIAAAQVFRGILIGQEQPAGQISSRSVESLKSLRRSPFAV